VTKTNTPNLSEPKRGSRSIKEWCEYRRYSHAGFYNMQRRGVAPKVLRLPGAPPRITNEADAEWLKACDNLPADIIAENEAISTERRDRTRGAGKVAAESPKHVRHRGSRQRETV
jgi:hypothetical protein